MRTKRIVSEIKFCVIKWNDKEKSIEHAYWNLNAYFIQKPLLVMTASWRLLYGETSGMHCSGVILAHSSTQTVFKSWRFRVPLFYELWSLVLSIDFLLDSSQVIGWAILAALLSFSETNWEFPWLCLGSLSCWNVHPCFIFIILVDGNRFFIKNVSVHFSIHPSFSYMNFASATPWCFWGDVQCHLTSTHGVYYGIQRIKFLSHLTRLYSPSISQAFLKVV